MPSQLSLFFSLPSISNNTFWLQALLKNKIACLYFTDLYFFTLVNRINVMVQKMSFAILDKEFVHLFTHNAQDCQKGFSKHFYEIMVSFMEARIVHPWGCNYEIHLCFLLHLSSLLKESSHKVLWFACCLYCGLRKIIFFFFFHSFTSRVFIFCKVKATFFISLSQSSQVLIAAKYGIVLL